MSFKWLLLETKGTHLCSGRTKQVTSAGAHRQRVTQVHLPLTWTRLRHSWKQKATYSMFELFQYTVCRLLALDRCKFVSASVRRLRENAVRAIIPPVLVHPWSSPLPSASPLLLSQATCRSQHPSGQKDLFKFPAALTITATSAKVTCSSTQIPSRRDPCGHLRSCHICSDFWLVSAAHFQVNTYCLASLLLGRATNTR